MIKSEISNYQFIIFTHRRFGRECSDDSVGVHLKKMGSPTNLRIRTDLHPLLAMPHLLPVKVHVSKMQNAGENFENRVLLLRSESQHLHGRQEGFEVLGIGFSVDFAVSTLCERIWIVWFQSRYGGRMQPPLVRKFFEKNFVKKRNLIQVKVFVRREQPVFVPQLLIETSQQLVEHVIVPFFWRLRDYSTFFEKILSYPSPHNDSAEKVIGELIRTYQLTTKANNFSLYAYYYIHDKTDFLMQTFEEINKLGFITNISLCILNTMIIFFSS